MLDAKYEYDRFFPVQLGHYVTYDVDSFYWDDFDCSKDTSTSQMRYTVADVFMDNQNRTSYRIDVDTRADAASPWTPDEAIYVTPTAQHLEYVQQNLRFIKLVYPVQAGITWDGNSFINTNNQNLQYLSGWEYQYSNIGEGFNTGRKQYDNTIVVLGTDQKLNNPEDTALIGAYAFRTYAKEIYAQDAGLIYREITRWTYDPNINYCRKGYSVIMRAIDNN